MSFRLGSGITQAARCQPYRRKPADPVFRPLRIFSIDPSLSYFDGGIATVQVPYEPLKPGPVGSVLEVLCDDGFQQNEPADLDDPRVLIGRGYTPSVANPKFHHQTVYAIVSLVCVAFRTALGRQIPWGFGGERLRIRTHVRDNSNACYDKDTGELRFGYHRNADCRYFFTALSHDCVAHESAHALLDGLRAHFDLRSNPEVQAFHEGFADLVAIFQHFTYPEVVRSAIQTVGGDLNRPSLLTEIARMLSPDFQNGNDVAGIRSAVGTDDKTAKANADAHFRGEKLVRAVFDAFLTIFRRKTAPYFRLATGGTGVLPAGALPPDLADVLAKSASRLASQILRICIRAIDYCPPVDLELGEFLRAMITADRELAPDDPYCYRDAFIEAFRKHKIYPSGVNILSEDALVWQPPEIHVPVIDGLTFAKLQFEGDPASAAGPKELQRQAAALGRVITNPRFAYAFGLAPQSEEADLPVIQSIRTARRVGPYESVVFDLVAEVTQCRRVDGTMFYGGSTIIIDPEGKVRYSIAKNVMSAGRLARQREYEGWLGPAS